MNEKLSNISVQAGRTLESNGVAVRTESVANQTPSCGPGSPCHLQADANPALQAPQIHAGVTSAGSEQVPSST